MSSRIFLSTDLRSLFKASIDDWQRDFSEFNIFLSTNSLASERGVFKTLMVFTKRPLSAVNLSQRLLWFFQTIITLFFNAF